MLFAALSKSIFLAMVLSAAPDAGALVPAPEPFAPQIADPLLTPAPRAKKELASWDEAQQLLRQTSTDERSAAAGVERAQGDWRQSLGVLLPNARLSVSGLYDVLNPTVPPGVGTAPLPDGNRATVPLGTASLSASQTLFDLSAIRGLSSAGAARDRAEASLLDVRRRVTQGLARALVAVVAAERVAELNRIGLAQALERAALTERTQQLGAATQLDVVRIQQDVEVARGTLISGDEQLRRTREALGLAVGSGEEVGVTPGFSLEQLVEHTLAQCRVVPWEQRPDLEAARANVHSVAETRRKAVAGYLPTLGVTSNVFAYTTLNPAPGRFANWNLAAVLSVPLWEGGARAGLVQERAGAQVQAELQLESSRRQVSVEVARSRRSISVSQALVSSATKARTIAAQLDGLTRRLFEVGRGSSLELVQSAQALRQADVTLATREFELVQARLDSLLTEALCDG